jgi:hypothetical protein
LTQFQGWNGRGRKDKGKLKVEGGSVKFGLEGNLLGFDCGLMQIEVKIGDSV